MCHSRAAGAAIHKLKCQGTLAAAPGRQADLPHRVCVPCTNSPSGTVACRVAQGLPAMVQAAGKSETLTNHRTTAPTPTKTSLCSCFFWNTQHLAQMHTPTQTRTHAHANTHAHAHTDRTPQATSTLSAGGRGAAAATRFTGSAVRSTTHQRPTRGQGLCCRQAGRPQGSWAACMC